MKKITFLVLAAFFTLSISCQVKTKQTKTKPTITQQKPSYLVGKKSKKDLQQAPYSSWYNRYHDSYKPDEATIKSLKKYMKGVTIKAFMGTWCGDSKRETPRFFKLLETLEFNEKNLELITVNRSKRTPDNFEKGLEIKRVPTFIFFRKGKEIGRYVEYPRESLEKDILAILSGKGYKHVYSDPSNKPPKKY